MKERKGKIRLHNYTGEPCRSVYKKSWEHRADIEELNPVSHLLKLVLDQHEEALKGDVEFAIRVVKYTRSSFERQI